MEFECCKNAANKIWHKTEAARETLLSMFLPRRCPVCQDIVRPRGALICPECRKKISFVREPLCRRCGKEILSPEVEYCYDCSTYERSFQGGISLMNYDKVGRTTMKAFKYQGRQEYAAYYIEEILHRYGGWIRNTYVDAIIPVPIHRRKWCKRGYNQAEVLARELSRRTGIPVLDDMLIRCRETRAQKELSARERQRNLEQAMKVRELPSNIKKVLLVDDIYTTGSTAEACTKVLLQAGVEKVYVVTVCIGKND